MAVRKNLDTYNGGSTGSGDERRLLPMLIGGIILVVLGMITVMAFV